MPAPQAPPRQSEFALRSERLGPLPLINHFLQRMGLEELLDKHVSTTDRRCAVAHARALGVLLRSIIVEREPVYRQQETVHGFASGAFGLSAEQMAHLSDDRIGRALDRLFDADRAALLTEVVVAIGQRFQVNFERLHNDSTSIAFCGQYRAAKGRAIRGQSAVAITYGFSKDSRPDLKQLLFILTVSADGVPVAFRCAAGNTSDSVTHIETWNTLRAVAGRADFLYVADSKLCSHENMRYIHREGGRFVTVMPRLRQEDAQFRAWIQTHTPDWELVWDRPNPRHSDGPRDRWYVFQPAVPSIEVLAHHLGVEHLADALPRRAPAAQPQRRLRAIAGTAPAAHQRPGAATGRQGDRLGGRGDPRAAPCRALPEGESHRARTT